MERQIVGLESWEKTVGLLKILRIWWSFEDVQATSKSAV